MQSYMKAAVLYDTNDIRYEDHPMPEIQTPDQIKLRVKAAGICGSDVPRVLGDSAWFYPIVLGHECCGEVVETGTTVTSLKVGDHVIIAPHIPCFHCDDCQNGYYGSCKDYGFIGTKQQGGFAEYLVVDQMNAVKLDDSIPYREAMVFEPATVACHGMRQADFRGGSTVAILGCGTVGIFAAQWAKAFGARQVVVFDVVDERLRLAIRLGSDAVVNSSAADWQKKAMELTDGKGFDYIFETAGMPATMKMSYHLVGTHGTICMIGYPSTPVTFEAADVFQMIQKEFRVVGSRMSFTPPFPGSDWTQTAEYFARGLLQYDDSMIFREFPLSQVKDAFDLFRVPGQVKGKVLLLPEN